ncbi:MAG TPA: hypothetical protein VNO52_19110 [Methylomirabilota bacterium]|nr:hypothetical protein [Methylomirabilota bacterium]
MKTTPFPSLICWLALPLLTTAAGPKDEIVAAARSLGAKPNYAWRSTVAVPEGSQFRPGPTDGKTERDGFTYLMVSFGDAVIEAAFKDGKAVVTNQEGEWELVSETDEGEGLARFRNRMFRNFKTPAAQAAELAAGTRDLKKEGDAYSGDLTEEGAKAQFRFGNVSGAKGSARFWVKDGVLTKYEVKIQGKVEFNGNERDVDRTTTVEIKDVGTTKVNVPEAAKKKLG